MAVSRVGQTSLLNRLWSGLSAWTVNQSGFQKFGLWREDLIMDDDPDVKEALRRLPTDQINHRNFRMKRALDLSMKHRLLPKEEWTKSEEDISYLLPVLEEVKKERKEREVWDRQ
ncbi:cytochrome b-c1 complex subunit 7-like [Oscarella lobularis]|uniref:cytochrome b-c1 complex subunit 7-like n=1 Tax=Oscarella lobularis TaxID=121494 RepID=UPI003313F62D